MSPAVPKRNGPRPRAACTIEVPREVLGVCLGALQEGLPYQPALDFRSSVRGEYDRESERPEPAGDVEQVATEEEPLKPRRPPWSMSEFLNLVFGAIEIERLDFNILASYVSSRGSAACTSKWATLTIKLDNEGAAASWKTFLVALVTDFLRLSEVKAHPLVQKAFHRFKYNLCGVLLNLDWESLVCSLYYRKLIAGTYVRLFESAVDIEDLRRLLAQREAEYNHAGDRPRARRRTQGVERSERLSTVSPVELYTQQLVGQPVGGSGKHSAAGSGTRQSAKPADGAANRIYTPASPRSTSDAGLDSGQSMMDRDPLLVLKDLILERSFAILYPGSRNDLGGIQSTRLAQQVMERRLKEYATNVCSASRMLFVTDDASGAHLAKREAKEPAPSCATRPPRQKI